MKQFFLIVAFLVVTSSVSAQCPSIVVKGPQGITIDGDSVTFRAEVAVAGPRLAYRWSVSAGTIERGQGTGEIMISTDASMAGTTLTATVEVDGLPSACEKTASEFAPVAPRIVCGLVLDEWLGDMKPNDQRSRLDNFFADLSNNPTHTGILVLTVTTKEQLNSTNKRLQFVVRHAAFRKFDRSRIWFSLEPGDEARTKAYRIPPGADFPCENCQIIKGSDIP